MNPSTPVFAGQATHQSRRLARLVDPSRSGSNHQTTHLRQPKYSIHKHCWHLVSGFTITLCRRCAFLYETTLDQAMTVSRHLPHPPMLAGMQTRCSAPTDNQGSQARRWVEI
jgi:hypothetical protein